jgi:hypothetical protein
MTRGFSVFRNAVDRVPVSRECLQWVEVGPKPRMSETGGKRTLNGFKMRRR